MNYSWEHWKKFNKIKKCQRYYDCKNEKGYGAIIINKALVISKIYVIVNFFIYFICLFNLYLTGNYWNSF